MTQEEKTRLSTLTNLELVEELLNYQQDADRYHELRAKAEYRMEEWEKYHKKLYETIDDVVSIKYMIVARMGGISGTGK